LRAAKQCSPPWHEEFFPYRDILTYFAPLLIVTSFHQLYQN
jgi:hypothetical protein